MYTPRGRARAARASRADQPARLRRRARRPRCGREPLRQRRRRHVERGELLDQALDPRAGRAARGRGRASARLAPLAELGDLLVGEDHQVLDQAVRLGLGDRPRRRPRRRRRRSSNSGSNDSTSSGRPRRRSASAAAASRASASGSATALGRRSRAGEDRVELVVVEPRVGADAAAVEAGRARPCRPAPSSISAVTARRSTPGREAAGLVAESAPAASARPCPARRCCWRGAAPRASSGEPGRTWAATSAMWIQSRIAVALALRRRPRRRSRAPSPGRR